MAVLESAPPEDGAAVALDSVDEAAPPEVLAALDEAPPLLLAAESLLMAGSEVGPLPPLKSVTYHPVPLS